INPGSYGGRYTIVGQTGTLTGTTTVNLAPGTYFIDNGTGLGGSNFSFTVDDNGLVNTTTRTATGAGSTLSFTNVAVTFEPGAYTGTYTISSYNTTPLTGRQTVVLPVGLDYSIDNGSTIAGSSFLIHTDAL